MVARRVVARIFALVDPAMVPVSTTSLLDGRSGTMLRVWWRILTTAGWMECPAGTLIVEDPEVTDDGTLSIGVPGLDVLSSRRGKYGASVVQVGGMTVSAALQRLFDTVAPASQCRSRPQRQPFPRRTNCGTGTRRRTGPRSRPWRGWWCARIVSARSRCARTRPVRGRRGLAGRSDLSRGRTQVGHEDVHDPAAGRGRVHVPGRDPARRGRVDQPDADSQTIVTEQRIESSTVTTVAAAESLARMSGERWARPQQSVQVTVPARPTSATGTRSRLPVTRPV